MLKAPDGEPLPVQVACLEGRVQQVFEEWHQLGQWLETDERLLSSVQAHTASVHASLATSSPRDQAVRSALAELLVIGQMQQFLLEQSMQQATRERAHLKEEGARVRQALGLLHRAPTSEEGR
ncbi:MAG TPA: hypothetical protein VKT82_29875 [Ktedonobacterales bacterium]|nr:hypothetical protein [Ktedonobacterales bacterium]